jgi:pimeloyl-ACP methyl ester carboxylesterase
VRRNAIVLGLASLPFAGCAAVRNRVSLARGCVDVRYQPPAGITFYARSMTSRHVRGTVAYDVAIADGVDPRTVDRVVYVLPGRGGAARNVFSDLNYGAPFAAAMSANATLRHAALVAVDAGETYFHPRTSGEDRLALVTEELPNAVAALTGSRPKREALIGMSMGGYGALLAAERQPARYRAVAVAGPAIFPSYEDEHSSVGDAFDSADDYARYDVIAHAGALRGVPVRIRCGSRDPFVPGVRAFAKACPSADVQIETGCHDDGFWRVSAKALLEFVAGHL